MKGQAAFEFMILISVLMAILAVFLWSDMSLNQRLIGIKMKTEAKKLCDKIAFEINTAVRAGNGYKREFYVDDSFYGVSDFDISVQNYTVYLDWDKGSVFSSIIVEDINGSVSKGPNLIKNVDGMIYVS